MATARAAVAVMVTAMAAAVVMVTAMAVAMAATMVEAAVEKTRLVTVMAGGTDNNQLKAAAEEIMAVEMVTATKTATCNKNGNSDEGCTHKKLL
jgi:hypothetical protein